MRRITDSSEYKHMAQNGAGMVVHGVSSGLCLFGLQAYANMPREWTPRGRDYNCRTV